MKIKITLTVVIATLLFAACGTPTNTTNTANNANNSNTAVVNSNQTAATNTATNTASSANTAAPKKDDGKIVGDYMVGDVKCTITPLAGDTKDLYFDAKCADNPKVMKCSRDDSEKTANLACDRGTFSFKNPDSGSGVYNSANGTFTDTKGKTVNVTRVQ